MIFDDLRSGSTAAAPENGCRCRNDSSDLMRGGGGQMEKPSKSFRRKRMELHRVRSISMDNSNTAGDPLASSNHKKKRSEGKQETKLMENSLQVVQLPQNGAVVGGSREAKCLSHGKISVIGRRREMEDALAVEIGLLKRGGRSYDFFGVYDGHGGWRVANACAEMLHKVVADVFGEESGEEINWGKVMAAGFRKMDEEVNRSGGAAVATTGSTAVVAVVGENEVVVANCGDSRAVLARGGRAVQLSDDHKPDRPDELERIELTGGKVINWNGQRVLGVLATSRSIGDEYLKPFVIPEPEVKVINRTSADEFLILASDGLWDVISNDIACQVVRRCLDGQIKRNNDSQVSQFHDDNVDEVLNESRVAEAAAVLAELAMARGSRDNISVIVVGLN